jgi:putative flippase GtrA
VSATDGDRLHRQALRFVLVGAINTAATYAIFVGLGLFIAPWIAYSIAFALGLLWVTVGSSRYVFRRRFSWRRALTFAAAYLSIFAVGQLVIRLVSPVGLPGLLLTSLVVLAVTTPLSFVAGRFVFRPSRPEQMKAPMP